MDDHSICQSMKYLEKKNSTNKDTVKESDVSIMVECDALFVFPLQSAISGTSITKISLLNTLECLRDPHICTSEAREIGMHWGGRTRGITRIVAISPVPQPCFG